MKSAAQLCRRHAMQGLAVPEFAVVGLLTFIILFGAIEVARLLYTWNALTDGTRRGARLAAVCPQNDPAIARVAIFRTPADGDTGISFPNLTVGNVQITYLDAAGNAGASPDLTEYVRVAIVNYQLELFIPTLNLTVTMPTFETTLPAENLGVVPDVDDPVCISPA